MASKAYKTYSKSYTKETPASRAFDEVISNKTSQQIPIKAEKTKWGDTSFTRVREDDPFEVTYKKVKVENETVDPFTFDLEEDGSPRKKKPANNTACQSVGGGGLGRPAIPNVKMYQKPVAPERLERKDNTKVEEEPDTESVSFRRPVKTYSRAGRKDTSQDENRQTTIDSKSHLSLKYSSQDLDSENNFDSQSSHGLDDDIDQKDIYSFGTKKEDSSSSQGNEDLEDDEDDFGSFNREQSSVKTYGGKGKVTPGAVQRITPKTHILQSDDDDPSGGATVLNFRSHYMDPAVYGQFKYIPQEEDPVGRLKNSKVLQQSEIKHGKGSTLIVICSPKPPADGCKTLHPVKTYKIRPQNAEDEEESEKNESEEYTKVESRKTKTTREARPGRAAKRQAMERMEESDLRAEEGESSIQQEDSVSTVSDDAPVTRRNTRNSDAKPRYNRIFRSRNKGLPAETKKEDNSGNIKETVELPEKEEIRNENDSNSEMVTEDVVKTKGSVDTYSPAKKKPKKESDTAFGFEEDEEIKEEAPEEKIENMQKENLQGSQDQQNLKQKTSQETAEEEPKLAPKRGRQAKNKKISILKEQEGDSQSSDGEFDSSQELASDSQASAENDASERESSIPLRERKIFKSKNSKADRKIFQSPKKSPAKAVYNVRPWHDDFDEEDRSKSKGGESTADNVSGPPKLQPISKVVPKFDAKDPPPLEPPKLTRAVHWPDRLGDEAYTSVHVTKEHKQLYTVVKNVKQAHECQEYGETQEFSDDVEYLLSGVQEGEPLSTRCLSCIGLAQKCILPAFRMHLRAHGTVAKIFGHLSDAVSDPSLALCTALLMFMLSRDRLNMDLDGQSLDLMLKLLGVDNQEEVGATVMGKRALNRNKDRAKEVYEQWKAQGGTADQPEIEDVSTGNLAMESLLSLTSRRAGEWFKEELRTLGALDHIVDTVCSCIEALGDDTTLLTDSAVENLKKIDRCLRVLENVSFVNIENQTYLISYKSGVLITSLCRSLATCEKCFPVYPVSSSEKVDKDSTGFVIYSCVLAILRVLLNLTHDNEYGCTTVGEQLDFISTVLTCILQTPQHVPLDFRFDILVLSLGLLINMVEHCEVNRRKLIDAETIPSYDETPASTMPVPATKALVQVFGRRFETAQQMEEQDFGGTTTPQASPNKSGEWKESDSGIEWVVASGSKKKKGTDEEEEEGEETQNRLKPPQDEFGNGNGNIDDEETFSRALHKAGKHMENSIVASYIALLLGCLIQDNTIFVSQVKQHLPNENFEDMISILKKFLGFMNLTTAVGSTGGKSIAHVIEVLEGC